LLQSRCAWTETRLPAACVAWFGPACRGVACNCALQGSRCVCRRWQVSEAEREDASNCRSGFRRSTTHAAVGGPVLNAMVQTAQTDSETTKARALAVRRRARCMGDCR
jgi:hypothetical protein